MKRALTAALILMLGAPAVLATAQEGHKEDEVTAESIPPATLEGAKQDKLSKERLLRIAGQDFISPLNTDARWVLLGGIGATLFVALNGHDLNKRTRTKTIDTTPLRQYGYVGEVVGWGYLNGIYSLAHLLHGHATGDKLSLKRAEIMGSASLFTLGATASLKIMINSRRPGGRSENDSFPSGHASMAFAFATVVAAEHAWYYGAAAMTMASFISYSRIHDDWHWLEDVVAGAGLGASYGLGVWLNRRKLNVPFAIAAVPMPDLKGLALGLSARF